MPTWQDWEKATRAELEDRMRCFFKQLLQPEPEFPEWSETENGLHQTAQGLFQEISRIEGPLAAWLFEQLASELAGQSGKDIFPIRSRSLDGG